MIFTSDNDTVYKISRDFLIPAITHQTKIKERHETLERFNAGEYPFLVTSRVLNEGVDVPAANVGIVLARCVTTCSDSGGFCGGWRGSGRCCTRWPAWDSRS